MKENEPQASNPVPAPKPTRADLFKAIAWLQHEEGVLRNLQAAERTYLEMAKSAADAATSAQTNIGKAMSHVIDISRRVDLP